MCRPFINALGMLEFLKPFAAKIVAWRHKRSVSVGR